MEIIISTRQALGPKIIFINHCITKPGTKVLTNEKQYKYHFPIHKKLNANPCDVVLNLVGNVVREPIQALVQPFPGCGACALDIPAENTQTMTCCSQENNRAQQKSQGRKGR